MDNTENVLLDPSLLLASNSMINTFDYLDKTDKSGGKYQFYLPKSFLRLLNKRWLPMDNPGIRFFLHNATPSDPEELYSLMDRYSNIVSLFEPTEQLRGKHIQMYKNLREELYLRGELLNEDLLSILFEEWVFMQEYSWVVSRIKKPFNRLISAGAVSMQFSRITVDMLIRRTLKKDSDYFLSNIDRLRALGKWIVVGVGSPALSFISPWLSGIPAVILLFDPEPRVHTEGAISAARCQLRGNLERNGSR